jgi:hypothetical protein
LNCVRRCPRQGMWKKFSHFRISSREIPKGESLLIIGCSRRPFGLFAICESFDAPPRQLAAMSLASIDQAAPLAPTCCMILVPENQLLRNSPAFGDLCLSSTYPQRINAFVLLGNPHSNNNPVVQALLQHVLQALCLRHCGSHCESSLLRSNGH